MPVSRGRARLDAHLKIQGHVVQGLPVVLHVAVAPENDVIHMRNLLGWLRLGWLKYLKFL